MTPTVFENFIIWPHSSSELGYTSVYWTIDSLDSVAPPKTPDFLIERITRCTDAQLDGAIILIHVGEPATAEALPRILWALQRRGFQGRDDLRARRRELI